jgi:hypothetical protein
MTVVLIFDKNDHTYKMRTELYVKNVYRMFDVESQTIETIIVFEDSTLLNNNKFSDSPYTPTNMKYKDVYCENYYEFLDKLKRTRTSVSYIDKKEVWNYDIDYEKCTANIITGFCNCCGTLTQDTMDFAQLNI